MAEEVIDLTSISPQKTSPCPICALPIPVEELPLHCEAHFAAEEPSGLARHDTDEQTLPAELLEQLGAADSDLVLCELCGHHIPRNELQSHEVAHALECEDLDLDGGGGDAEQLHEELQAKYGFRARKRPGKCFTCGGAGHWTSDCPQNPHNIAARARVIPNVTHEAIVAAQQPEPQYTAPVLDPVAMFRQIGESAVAQRLPKEYTECLTLLSGPVMHFGSKPGDTGWGCGYRNIQMQVDHLLATQPSLREVLFGNFGHVPDISSLQSWIEVAWKTGFDAAGAEQLGWSLQGGKKWIGTTEAATVLRYFGLHAVIVDFGVDKSSADEMNGGDNDGSGSGSGSKKMKLDPEYGDSAGGKDGTADSKNDTRSNSDMSGVHYHVQCDGCGAIPIYGKRYHSQVLPNYDLCGDCYEKHSSAAGPFTLVPIFGAAQQKGSGKGGGGGRNASGGEGKTTVKLLEWVFQYFSTTAAATPKPAFSEGAQPSARLNDLSRGGPGWRLESRFTSRPPLYLQHEGHSRTIVGIERKKRCDGGPDEFSLLLLDPGVSSYSLKDALKNQSDVGGGRGGRGAGASSSNAGRGRGGNASSASVNSWQKLLKRGAHTLKESQYQIMYCPEGVVPIRPGSEEYDALKILAAEERF